jgi:hypothetical protein
MSGKKPEVFHEAFIQIPLAQRRFIVDDVVEDPDRPGKFSPAMRSHRDDPVAGLYARRAIDTAQYSAARVWQGHWQTAHGCMVRAIDPTREPVDGRGERRDAFTDRQHQAVLELREVGIMLGWEGDRIARLVLADRLTITELSARIQRPAKYSGLRFRECLETMAKRWSLA